MASADELEARLSKSEAQLAQCERELEQRALETLVGCALDACYVLTAARDADGHIEDFVFAQINVLAETQLGQPREAVLGARLCELYPFHREVSPVTGSSLFDDYVRVHETGAPLRREVAIPNLPTGTMWYVQQVTATHHGIAMMTRDVTRDKQAFSVQAELEQRARRVQSMESLGMLAGGVAHDFNNLLLAIGCFAELAQQQMRSEPDRAVAALDQVLTATRRAAELTQQLLVWSSQRVTPASEQDVGPLVERNMRLIRGLLPESLQLKLELYGEPLRIQGNESQLAQVLLNLCLNARDAMPNGGELTVRTSRAHLGEGDADLNPGETPRDVARLQVIDTGQGMDANTLQRIFEPFFTTKEVGSGTGLGLALVYSIVGRHGGAVRVRSTVGDGTTFTIDLPLSGTQASPALLAEPSKVEGGNETILVIDDETAVRVLLAAALERAGYRALVASTGVEGIEVFRRLDRAVDLIILDAVMPGMNGYQAYEALRAMRPDVRVLFSTGYERDVFPLDFFQDGTQPLLRKPYDVQTLLRAVRAVLTAR